MKEERSMGRALACVLVVGALLWTMAAQRSLWNDEFHTLHHASAVTFSDFLASLETGNHPPLAFLLVRWSHASLGDSHLALRCWSVVVGLLVLAMTWRVARRLPDPEGRAVAPWLVVLSSFTLMIFSEARMYGLLALAVLGLLETLLATFEGKSRGWWAALWIPLGLYSHYYFWQYGLVLAVVVLGAAALRPDLRQGVLRLIVPALVGLALFLPWGLTGFRAQLTHDMPSGGTPGVYANLLGYCQGIAHLLFMNSSIGGSWVTLGIALPGTSTLR